MGSWIEELEWRAAAVKERIEGPRRQIAELTERLAAEEQLLPRLEITRGSSIPSGREPPATATRNSKYLAAQRPAAAKEYAGPPEPR